VTPSPPSTSERAVYHGLPSCAAAGIASPGPQNGERAFVAARGRSALSQVLDIDRLLALRRDRRRRGFLDYATGDGV